MRDRKRIGVVEGGKIVLTPPLRSSLSPKLLSQLWRTLDPCCAHLFRHILQKDAKQSYACSACDASPYYSLLNGINEIKSSLWMTSCVSMPLLRDHVVWKYSCMRCLSGRGMWCVRKKSLRSLVLDW